jgi:hypothetical protein
VVVAVTVVCAAWLGFASADPPPATAARSNSLTETAEEYSYRLSGTPKTGWARVTAVASGDLASAIPAIGTGLAPGLPFLLGPGGVATSITVLDAGRYALLSFLKTPDGTSDAANGMVRILAVDARRSDLSPPTKHVVDVTTSDSAITLPDGTLPARGWARITTTASRPRDFELFRYSTPDATFESASAYFKEFFSSGSAPPGAAPAVIVGNISSIRSGAVVYYRLSLERADYVVVNDTATDHDGSAQLHQDVTVE